MGTPDEKENNRNFFGALFKRSSEMLEITDYYAHDVDTDQPVHITASGSIAGNVKAPQVWIAGLLQGFVVTRELLIASGGQLVGDVLAVDVDVQQGGKLRGLMVTITHDEYERLLARAKEEASTRRGDQAEASEFAVHLNTTNRELEAGSPETALDIIHLLQAEAGASLGVPPVHEQVVARPLQDGAGGALIETDALELAFDEAKQQLSMLASELEKARQARVELELQYERQAAELESVRSLLRQRATALDDLELRYQEKEQALAEAEAHNRRLEEQLTAVIDRAEGLARRVESLESALQASVQHNAEQEESLLHWQELAETTQSEMRASQKRLEEVQEALARSEETAKALQGERERRERWLQQIQDELDALKAEQVSRLEMAQRSDRVELEQRLAELERALDVTQAEVEAQQDQILWYRTSLTASQGQLTAVQMQLAEKVALLQTLRQEAVEQQTLADEWQGRVGRLSELLYDAAQRIKELERDLQAQRRKELDRPEPVSSPAGETKARLQQRLRQYETQVRALEMEVERYREAFAEQGMRLAEARAEQAERHLALQRAQSLAEERALQIQKIRQLAAERIQQLEATIARLQELPERSKQSPP